MLAQCFQPSPLTLGTVQLGLPYGVANASGQPDETETEAILSAAHAGGMTTLDTARSYGAAEARIGRWLRAASPSGVRVVTKLPALPPDQRRAPRAFLDASLRMSASLLGRERLDLVLAHRGEDLLTGGLASMLESAMERGDVGAFGASVYAPEVAHRILNQVPIHALQVPLSIVDRRFLTSGVVARAQTIGVRVFARSVLLQGSLILPEAKIPPHLTALLPVVRALNAVARQTGCSVTMLAVRAVLGTPGIDSTVIGVERALQLVEHFSAAAVPPLPADVMQRVQDAARDVPASVLDPSRWPQAAA